MDIFTSVALAIGWKNFEQFLAGGLLNYNKQPIFDI